MQIGSVTSAFAPAAQATLRLTVAVTNRVVDAYKEISSIQI